VGWVIPNRPNCCFANASEMKTLPKPIFPVGGLMVVVVVVDVVVVLVGGVPVIVPDVEVVRVSLIGVPFRSPVTIAFESAPKNHRTGY
jgi:hypothetical protein